MGGVYQNELVVINAATRAIITRAVLPGNGMPWSMTVSPDGAKIYVGSVGIDTISVINATNLTMDSVWAGGYNVNSLALNRDGSKLYVAHNSSAGDSGTSIIDTATLTVTTTVPIIDSRSIGITPDETKIYVGGNATTSVIDAATNTITATLPNVQGAFQSNQFILEPNITGKLARVTVDKVLCQNLTTRQSISINNSGATTWDCKKAGLVVHTGDQVSVTSKGLAQ